MVTRAQKLIESAYKLNGNTINTEWYLSRSLWDTVLNAIRTAIDIFIRFKSSTNMPIAQAIHDTLKQEVTPAVKDIDISTYLTIKIGRLARSLSDLNREEDPMPCARLEAQLDILNELLMEIQENGEERPHH